MNFDTKTNQLGWLINQLTFTIQQSEPLRDAWQNMTDEQKRQVQRDLYESLRYNL